MNYVNDIKHNSLDIYYQNDEKKIGVIIDATTASDERLKNTCYETIPKYRKPQEHLIFYRKLKKVLTIPVIFTVNGLIYYQFIIKSKEFELNIDLSFIIRQVINTNMKHLLFHVGDNDERLFI